MASSFWEKLDVKIAGENAWRPASTVDENVVQAYFATHGAEVVEERKRKRAERRDAARRSWRPHFLGDWSSESVKSKCQCKTHKESVAAVKTASRSAGFMTAVSESGFNSH
eukprot:9833580-Karenia_brevis.AAC.1